jgi:hypothetical protein
MKYFGILLLFLCTPAFAEQVVREQATLGKLADSADRIVLGRVAAGGRLDVEEAIKGSRSSVELGLGEVQVGERGVYFLVKDKLPSESHRVLVASDAEAREVVAATRARLPRLLAHGDGDAIRRELVAELASSVTRVREDAVLDLLARRELPVDEVGSAAVARALGAAVASHAPTLDLLRLAARMPSSAARASAVQAALAAPDTTTVDAAARLLGAGEVAALAQGLTGSQAVNAARALGSVTGGAQALAGVLSGDREDVRRAALTGLALGSDAEGAKALAAAATTPRSAAEGRIALAALALNGAPEAGKLLAAAARSHADGALRRLAVRLTKNPVQTARLVLEQGVDPSAADATPARGE